MISRGNTNLGLGELRYELKPLSPLQRAAMFFKIAEPYLLQKGTMMQHYKELSETCERISTTDLSQLRDSQIYEVLSEHDLFINLTNGLPEQIHSIAQMAQNFDNLTAIYEHLRYRPANFVSEGSFSTLINELENRESSEHADLLKKRQNITL